MTDLTEHELGNLLSLDAGEFVLACYRKLLHRDGDPVGVAYYTSRITATGDKIAVAAEIASSNEAASLPATQKQGAVKILALHSSQLIGSGRTPKLRRRAAEHVSRYLQALAGPAPKIESQSGDPFSIYLHEVIEDEISASATQA